MCQLIPNIRMKFKSNRRLVSTGLVVVVGCESNTPQSKKNERTFPQITHWVPVRFGRFLSNNIFLVVWCPKRFIPSCEE